MIGFKSVFHAVKPQKPACCQKVSTICKCLLDQGFLKKLMEGLFMEGITESILNVTIYYSKNIVIKITPIFRLFLNKFVSFVKLFKNFQLLSL